MSDKFYNTNTVSFEGNLMATQVSQINDEASSDSGESPPVPPPVSRTLDDYTHDSVLKKSSTSATPTDSPGKVTNDTSIFVAPISTRYLTVPRIAYDTSTKCVIPKETRPSKQTDLRKLRDLAVLPLENQIGLIPLDDSEEQILNNYNLQMRVRELRRRLVRYDIEDMFQILQFLSSANIETIMSNTLPVSLLPERIDLLER